METKNVKQLLTEIKNNTLLAVDLSYCSILFGDRDMAKEVVLLSKSVDDLRYQMEKGVMMAAKGGVDEESLIGILRIASYSERIANMAEEISKTVINEKVHEIVKIALSEAEEKFVMIKIPKNSEKIRVDEIGKEKGVWVIAIKRGKKWIFHPSARQELESLDVIYGTKE